MGLLFLANMTIFPPDMRTRPYLCIVGFASFLGACSSGASDDVAPDSAVLDSGAKDSAVDSALDGAVIDAAPPIDAAIPDARVIDARVADVSTVDAYAGDSGNTGLTGSVMVVRVGDGTGALSNASAGVVLEERSLGDGSLLRMIPIPTADDTAPGTNKAFTIAGTGGYDGQLTRSADGHYLVLGGYHSGPGITNIANSSTTTVLRVVARVAASGTVDTSTLVNSFTGNNVRGVASIDGSHFWVVGSSSGVQYVALGSDGTAGTNVQISSTPANMRAVNIILNNLYASSASGTTDGVLQIGTGVPATAAAATLLTGFPTASGPSPSAFVGFDSDGANGIDVIYLADDRTTAGGGGVQKWTNGGSGWVLAATFNNGLTAGVRGVTALPGTGSTLVIASTAENPSRLVAYVDDGVNTTPTVKVIQTAATNTFYRGVALPPQ